MADEELMRDGSLRTMAKEELAMDALPNDVLLMVCFHLERRDVAISHQVSRAWSALLGGSELLWRGLCQREWADKEYVPASLQVLSEGRAAVAAARAASREKLMRLRVSELKDRMRSLKLQSRASELIEKGDFADCILRAQTSASELLNEPSLLLREGEPHAKGALRLSLDDSERLAITEQELTSLTFSVRMRNDGPLADAICFDPYWAGKGVGKARFTAEGHVEFHWPPDPDADGAPMDPFLALGMETAILGWSLEGHGLMVQMSFNGQEGPKELVCRHPTNWGWVLYSQGTCWTSWEMPPCRDRMCTDPHLQEAHLWRLPSKLQRSF